MELKGVNSSNLYQIGYISEETKLRVVFVNGAMYDYINVPEKVYKELLQSESKGKFFHKNIRNSYKYEKVG